MSGEEWLVDGYVLDPDHPLHPLQFQDSVQQKEWIAVPQKGLDPVDVHCAAGGW